MVKDMPLLTNDELLGIAREVLTEEASALDAAASRLGESFAAAARMITSCEGRVVVSGLGKSGLVGRKIASTFASLGIPAFFLHAAEGAHGDLGMVCRDDAGLFISNSGETAELLALLPYFRRIGAPVISMSGRADSTLARNSDIFIDAGVVREADPLGLAPTSSTTVQMALGDAIAGVSVKLRNLGSDDFALFHPGGSLGRSLLMKVSDLMGSGGNMPVTRAGASVKDALFEITSKGYGATIITGGDGLVRGIFTDGDLRRLMESRSEDVMSLPVEAGMTQTPRMIEPDKLATEAMRVMERLEISVLIAAESNRPVGMLHLHDILRAGLS
ncbi:D-arabinose 5-phosphate isomerase [Synergistales bacterium]|nr:D-arabinose 5-phosphate isomerase [Synergistales bacterium]